MTDLMNIHVLLVESDSTLRSVISDFLGGEGFEVSIADTAALALEQLKETAFDALIVNTADEKGEVDGCTLIRLSYISLSV